MQIIYRLFRRRIVDILDSKNCPIVRIITGEFREQIGYILPMKLAFRIAFLFTVSVSTLSAWAARGTSSYQKGACETHLTYTQSQIEFDFKASELEALYLEIVKMAAQLDSGTLKKGDTEKFMNMKAEFFNDSMPVIRTLRAYQRDGVDSSLKLRNVLDMIGTLGADFRPFITHAKARKNRSPKNDSGRATTIGFVLQSETPNIEPNEKVRLGFETGSKTVGDNGPQPKRSIGFSSFTLRPPTGPARDPGHLKFAFDFDTQTAIIQDGFTGITYRVKGTLLNSLVGLNEEKTFAVKFDDIEEEWILSYKRRVNPEGKIGF